MMFCVWQMGFIYFIGPSLNIDGRTPLPVDTDNITPLIVAGYVLSILAMIFLPNKVIAFSRLSASVALLTSVGLFLPLGTDMLILLIYIQCFCCCFMIGFESATMVYYFTLGSVVKHLLVAYPIGYTLIAFIQSDFLPLDFSAFRILTVAMLILLLIFYIKLPANSGISFAEKSDCLILPKRFLCGFLLLAFLGALLGVIAPAAVGSVKNGVFAAYIGCALSSAVLYLLYKKTGRHPICFVTYIIGISAIGYVLLVVSEYAASLAIIAAVFVGIGMAACALLPLFSMLVVKQYPSRYIVPGYIALAMLAVIVQSVLVEAFRSSKTLLNLAYLVVVIILAIIFVMLEPFLIYSMKRRFDEQAVDAPQGDADTENTENHDDGAKLFELLTKRENEIVGLISCGHSNGDIAKMLFISEHTVKDHTKNIYRKLGVHSRYELTALVTKSKTKGL